MKEGDHVKKGDVLLRLESVQPAADVNAQRAGIDAADAGVKSAEANDVSSQADIKSRAADLEHAKLDWERGQLLFKEGLIPKQDYDTRKATYDGAVAALASAQARAEQARAQLGQARSGLTQNQAMLGRLSDILNKTTYTAPINGVVTYIAVRVGENVVPGIQNATGSYLMTISDMSVVTSEVMVDETDIVSVKAWRGRGSHHRRDSRKILQRKSDRSRNAGGAAQFRPGFDAIHNGQSGSQGFQGCRHAAESAGRPASRALLDGQDHHGAEEKCDDGSDSGARGTNEKRSGRGGKGERPKFRHAGGRPARSRRARPMDAASSALEKNPEIQGVFVVRNKRAQFVPVATGITGVTDIEVLNGLQEGDQIITGSYKTLRTLKPDARVKVDNSPPKAPEEN